LAPPLERLCALCKELDAWLCAGPQRLAVLSAQTLAGKERLGVAVSAFMHYSLICGGDDQALDRYAMARFIEERVGDFPQPSNKRSENHTTQTKFIVLGIVSVQLQVFNKLLIFADI